MPAHVRLSFRAIGPEASVLVDIPQATVSALTLHGGQVVDLRSAGKG